MKVLILHNSYQLHGGEDGVVAAEAQLLAEAGHQVTVDITSNDSVSGVLRKARVALEAHGSRDSAKRVHDLVRQVQPDVVHVHNFFPLLSPSIHQAASSAGAAVVQTLHNYRLLCANGTFLRNGQVCEKCTDGGRLWGIYHGCYRNSVVGSAAVASMQAATLGSSHWLDSVHRFIALSEFGRSKFIGAGVPEDRIVVKPNFAPMPSPSDEGNPRSGAVYVGRLSVEKGVDTLVTAWRHFPELLLTIVGDGPERERLQSMAPSNVLFTGARPHPEALALMSSASILVVPSRCYEGFPVVVAEAFSLGLPVLAASIGALAEIVQPGRSGAHFAPGDPDSLVRALQDLVGTRASLVQLSAGARDSYETLYSPATNLRQLERIYDDAVDSSRGRARYRSPS